MTSPEPGKSASPEMPSPVGNPPDDPRLRRILDTACRARGLDAAGARLIHRYNNAIYLLPRAGAVARLTVAQSVDRMWATQRAAAWLADEYGVAATRPLPAVDAVTVDDATVGFWAYYPQPDGPRPTSAHLARTLETLHQAEHPPVPLRRWMPLTSLSTTLAEPATAAALPEAERAWLAEHIEETRTKVNALYWPLGIGVIHGDAWAGNLLWDSSAGHDAVVLGDWDNVCVGPREVDLIPSWHAALRYGRGRAWSDAFARTYGYDLAKWSGFDTLLGMRDLVQLTGPLRRAPAEPALAAALRQRFDAIRSGDRTGVWRAF
ncbi:MAG: aminoglycoside phosphotransferase family protein [Dactylosporangium sp.]|nr:aminoglycoside phosphotransferase family protein [Dactylosporangium sp.]NNJ62893.1 aminoglycoside phosphotransferase family protein [Dactylosporangium sp.]